MTVRSELARLTRTNVQCMVSLVLYVSIQLVMRSIRSTEAIQHYKASAPARLEETELS